MVLIASRSSQQGPKWIEDGTEGAQRFAISIGDQVVAGQPCVGIGNIMHDQHGHGLRGSGGGHGRCGQVVHEPVSAFRR
jgi:hypothetical protein